MKVSECIFPQTYVYVLSLPPAVTHTTHEETKNTWARDDPAILILMAGGMVGVSSFVLLQLSPSTSDIMQLRPLRGLSFGLMAYMRQCDWFFS